MVSTNDAPLGLPLQAYTFPATFKIGHKETSGLLVTPAQLRGHLGLLRLFWDLRQRAESVDQDSRLPAFTKRMDPELRWAYFVTLAVDRFERWVKNMHADSVSFIFPPIDVVMVWHAYLLNPGWFSEDTARITDLKTLGMLSEKLAHAIETNAFDTEPSDCSIQAWVQSTSSPYDPFDSAAVTEHRKIQCPHCRIAIDAPFITDDGMGYAQKNFSTSCPNSECRHVIHKDKLGVFKLVCDLVRGTEQPDLVLAGTLWTPAKALDVARGRHVKKAFLNNPDYCSGTSVGPAYEDKLMKATAFSAEHLRESAAKHMKHGGGRLLKRIMGAYSSDSIASIDLVGAVLRQGSFVEKMHDLRWTEQGYFDGPEDQVVLQHSVARYHAFLDLIASSHGGFFVPTLDIDLAWHTHQLSGSQYMKDTLQYVGRHLDHDDKVEEDHLSHSFDETCHAWHSKFHVAYMHCGCPLPGDHIGEKLVFKIKHHNHPPAFLQPPNNPDILGATHPSDHNSVFAFHHTKRMEAARTKRKDKVQHRHARDATSVLRGKLSREAFAREEGHEQAFLVPVPYNYCQSFGGCMAWHGGVDGEAGSCATGADGCATGHSACRGGGCGAAGCGGGV
ncbi:hypothetical protein FIBSPDRAFT_767494 [Athelia psychrophila]|uniref:Uncharacterized protein n=1 Tax=Athelia psychrophila TaxID=1759441 RepID=A0A167UWX4_9AGAM|nr:hypothetical protein FIBSPDRAFT_767494 [Fibularhizoctonia sp. CBS 109695]